MLLPRGSVFLCQGVGKMLLWVSLLLITSFNNLFATKDIRVDNLKIMSKDEILREQQIDSQRTDFNNCDVVFSTDKTTIDNSYVEYRVDRLGDSVAYGLDYKPAWDSSIWSTNLKVQGIKDSQAFWKDILFFAGAVMTIYRVRKAHLGYVFLSKWALDVHNNPYNSAFTTVYKRGDGGIDAVVGTLRFIESDVRDQLPLEKFLDIGLKTEGFEKYEIGLLTIEKLPSIEDKKRILLELWLHLVNYFKDKNKQTIRVYAFADKFCTRLYKGWGFVPVKEFYKNGVLVKNDETHKDMLKLEQGPNMEVLTYELSKESLLQLLNKASDGMLSINSSMVRERLNNVGLSSFFDRVLSL